MLRFAADENFDVRIVRGLLRRAPSFDILRVQDAGLARAGDPEILRWAAEQGRLVLTHDVTTMTRFAYERVDAGLPMPGVVEIPYGAPMGQVIEDVLLLAEAVAPEECEGQVLYLPL